MSLSDAPTPAATVILIRDAAGGLETLMLRRNSKMAFGGMWVFPGGRIDPEDAIGLDPGDELGVARRAAAREALEEADLPVAADSLVLFSRWTPPDDTPHRRFSTWIFLATAPEGSVTIDGHEIHEHAWLSPAEILRRRDAGEIELAPPTWVSLLRLARSGTVADSLEEAAAAEFEHFHTRLGLHDGVRVCMWHGDAGYEAADATLDGPRHRLWMEPVWRYERSF